MCALPFLVVACEILAQRPKSGSADAPVGRHGAMPRCPGARWTPRSQRPRCCRRPWASPPAPAAGVRLCFFADLACRHTKHERPNRPLGRKAKGCHIFENPGSPLTSTMYAAHISYSKTGALYRQNPYCTLFHMQNCCLSSLCGARLARVHEAAVGAQPAHRRGKQLRAPELAVAHHVVGKRVRHHARCAHDPPKVCTGDVCQPTLSYPTLISRTGLIECQGVATVCLWTQVLADRCFYRFMHPMV